MNITSHLHRLAAIASTVVLALGVAAQTAAQAPYPERDIEIIIPFNAGGGFDSYIRALAPWLERHLPNRVRVLPRNSAGAGGRRGANEIYRARPDGYTIGAFNLPGVLIPQLMGERIGYDLSRVTWLATLSDDPYFFAVRADSPLRSMRDVLARREPILYSATGPGSTAYIATAVVNARLGIPFEIVTGYTGSSAYLVGLLRGDVDAVLVNHSAARPYLDAGDIRALASFGAAGDDPSVLDSAALGAPELDGLRLVRMIGGPPGLPPPVRETLERALLAALEDPGFRQWLTASGNDVRAAGGAATSAAVDDMAEFYERFKQYLD